MKGFVILWGINERFCDNMGDFDRLMIGNDRFLIGH